ncbi:MULTISPECIES: hypothetical protein [unclassified Methylobacterium]|nr:MULTISPECIES: hypothetical protein [Methylobacterium]WFT82051.1 hypothetical protein QA634_09425 [Methylobacterium nodulans]
MPRIAYRAGIRRQGGALAETAGPDALRLVLDLVRALDPARAEA